MAIAKTLVSSIVLVGYLLDKSRGGMAKFEKKAHSSKTLRHHFFQCSVLECH